METQFENAYQPEETLFLEYAHALRARWKNLLAWGALALFAVGLVISLAARQWPNCLLAVIGLAACCFLLVTPRIQARALLASANEAGGGALHQTVLLFGEKIVLNEGEFSMEFAYRDIADVRESERLYILLLTGHDVLLVRKGAFTRGAEEDFLPFIREKCRASAQ